MKEGLTPLHYAASAEDDENHFKCVLKLLKSRVGLTWGRKTIAAEHRFTMQPLATASSASICLWQLMPTNKTRDNDWFTPYQYTIE